MTVDESYWTLEEELKLLDSMIIYGPDNWEDVSKQLVNRSPAECENHYVNNFLLNPKYSELTDVAKSNKFNYSNTRHCNDSCCCLQFFDCIPYEGGFKKHDDVKINCDKIEKLTVSDSMTKNLSDTDFTVQFNGFYDFQKNDVNFKKEAVDESCTSLSTELYYPSFNTIFMEDDLDNLQTNNNCKKIGNEVQKEVTGQPCMLTKNYFKQNFSNISAFTNHERRDEKDSLPVRALDLSDVQNVTGNLHPTNVANSKEIEINMMEFSLKSIASINKKDFLCDIEIPNFGLKCPTNTDNLLQAETFRLFNSSYDTDEFSFPSVEEKVEELLNAENNDELKIDLDDCVNQGINCIKIVKPGFDIYNNLLSMQSLTSINTGCSPKNTDLLDMICYNYKLNNSCDSVESFSKNSSEILSLMTGYNQARNEFDVEYDNKAEEVLMCLRCNNDKGNLLMKDDLLQEISIAVIFGYNLRLSERLRRKYIVRCYDLINPLRAFSWFNKQKLIIGEKSIRKLIRFLHLMHSEEFDHLLKQFGKLYNVKYRLNKLIEYRQQGLTKLGSIELFELLKRQRDELLKKLRSSVTPVVFFNSSLPIISSSSRRAAPPITVKDMPGYSQLDEVESDFCSVNRILPNLYLQFKDILMNECIKKNGIKLAHARIILKIDVNKTRKLYDFLLQKNLIWSPNSSF